jgi:N utilization substance protein B
MKVRRGTRSIARERALQALYQVDLAGADPLDALSNAWKDDWKNEDIHSDEQLLQFSELIVRGVSEHLAQVDDLIEKHSHHWRIERMSRVDRNVLRLAVYELRFCSDVPRKVVLNEAIELAKRYGTEESGSFVNGVLDKIASYLNGEKA